MKPTTPKPMPTAQLINELQSCGVRLVDPKAGHESRRGGAGPSDHKAMTIDSMTVMVPVHTAPAFASPYVVEKPDALGPQHDQPRRHNARQRQLSDAPALLRPHDRGRHSVLEDRGAAQPRRACDHGVAKLHPLPKPDQDLSILRHRAIARRRTDDRAQDAGAARRGRQGRRRT